MGIWIGKAWKDIDQVRARGTSLVRQPDKHERVGLKGPFLFCITMDLGMQVHNLP